MELPTSGAEASSAEGLSLQRADGCTPLFLASYLGHLDVVRILLRSGADPAVGREEASHFCERVVSKRTVPKIHYNTASESSSHWKAVDHSPLQPFRVCIRAFSPTVKERAQSAVLERHREVCTRDRRQGVGGLSLPKVRCVNVSTRTALL